MALYKYWPIRPSGLIKLSRLMAASRASTMALMLFLDSALRLRPPKDKYSSPGWLAFKLRFFRLAISY